MRARVDVAPSQVAPDDLSSIDGRVAWAREEAIALALRRDVHDLETEGAATRHQAKVLMFEKRAMAGDLATLEESNQSLAKALEEQASRCEESLERERVLTKRLSEHESALGTAQQSTAIERAQEQLLAKNKATELALGRELEQANAALQHAQQRELNANDELAIVKSECHVLRQQYEGLSDKVAGHAASKLAREIELAQDVKRDQQRTAEMERLQDELAVARGALVQMEAGRSALQIEVGHIEESSEAKIASLLQAFDRDRMHLQEQLHDARREAARDHLAAAVASKTLSNNLKVARSIKASAQTLSLNELKKRVVELEAHVNVLETEAGDSHELMTSLDSERASLRTGMRVLKNDLSQAEVHLREVHAAFLQKAKELKESTYAAQTVMTEFQSTSKTHVRESTEQARRRAESLAEEYRARAVAAETKAERTQREADEIILGLKRDMQKLSNTPKQQIKAEPPTASLESVLPPQYATLRGELQRVEDAVLSLMSSAKADGLLALLHSAGRDGQSSIAKQVVRGDTRRMTELVDALDSLRPHVHPVAHPHRTLDGTALAHSAGEVHSTSAAEAGWTVAMTPDNRGVGMKENSNESSAMPSRPESRDSRMVPHTFTPRSVHRCGYTRTPANSTGPSSRVVTPASRERAASLQDTGAVTSSEQHIDPATNSSSRGSVVAAAPAAAGRGTLSEALQTKSGQMEAGSLLDPSPCCKLPPMHVIGSNGSRAAKRAGPQTFQSESVFSPDGSLASSMRAPKYHQIPSTGSSPSKRAPPHQRIAQQTPQSGQLSSRTGISARRTLAPLRSDEMVETMPRAQSVPVLPLHAGQPTGSQFNVASESARPVRGIAELYTRSLRGTTPLTKQQERDRDAWLSHGSAHEDFAAVHQTCTCTPLAMGSRPISQPPQSRSHATFSSKSATRSFWAHELPALAGSSPGMALQELAQDSYKSVLAVLSSRDASKLDELAVLMARMLDHVTETSHPGLIAAIRQAGIQHPTSKAEDALLAAPSVHDLVELLHSLSALITYGVVVNTSSSNAEEDHSVSQHFKREVAQLRRSLQARVDADGEDNALTPRFSRMAQAVIRREEQLQRTREVLRTQRATTQEGLKHVRNQLLTLQTAPRTETYAVLQRMEAEHLEAAQKWEYRRECLNQERLRLMELAMKAFCKVVYVDQREDFKTLVHGYKPGGDAHGTSIAPSVTAEMPSRPRTVPGGASLWGT